MRRACVIFAGGGSTPGCMRYPDGGGLSAAGRARLGAEPDKGPAVHGWVRISAGPGPGDRANQPAVPRALHAARLGFTPQVPFAPGPRARRRRDHSVADRDVGQASRLAVPGAYLCFEDEAGQAMRPVLLQNSEQHL
jgi:hypothetical protein